MTPRNTLWDHIEPTGFCWLWRGGTWKGYGRFSGRSAHRTVYESLVGPVPHGLELDHLCRIPLCVNPDHLDPVTRLENMRRRGALLTHCRSGHRFSVENTYLRRGQRQCRTCNRAAVAAYQERMAA